MGTPYPDAGGRGFGAPYPLPGACGVGALYDGRKKGGSFGLTGQTLEQQHVPLSYELRSENELSVWPEATNHPEKVV